MKKDSCKQHIYLRQLTEQDAEGMLEWMHDKELCGSFRFDGSKCTIETAKRFILSSMTGQNKHYAITDDTNEYLGTISLKNIDNIQAEYAIALRRKAAGTGIAGSATKEVLCIAFEELKLERVYLNVFADNIRAIKLYEKAGFRYISGRDSKITVDKYEKQLKWYSMEREHYEEIR